MKKFIRGLTSLILKLSLFNLAFATALFLVLGTPVILKRAISDSKLYDSVVDNVIESSQEASQGQGFPINQPEVKTAVKQAFPPETLQDYSEAFIDGTYNWLDGRVEKPDFRIDLAPAKQKLAEGVADYAQRRYSGLPVCTLSQLRQLSPDIDPFNVPCQVPGISATSARQDVINTVANSDQFLGQTVITAESMPKDAQGKTVFDNLAPLPGIAKLLRLAPWVLGGLSILLAAGLVALHDKKRSGFRSVGVALAGTGLFVLISTLLVIYMYSQVNKPGGLLNRTVAGSFQEPLLSITHSLSGAINRYLVIFSICYLVLGSVILLYLHFTDKKLSPEEQQALLDSMADEKNKPVEPISSPKETNNTKV